MTDKLSQILQNFRDDRDYREDVLERCVDSLIFARWTHYSDDFDDFCGTGFRGQFDLIRREKRRITSEFRQNPVTIKYEPVNEGDDDVADILTGVYRTEILTSRCRDVFSMAQEDQLDCGFGAWRIITEEKSDDPLNTNKELERIPIPEAVRKVFFDQNSVRLDKSDAMRCSVLTAFNESGYKAFLESEDIDTDDVSFVSFDQPYEPYNSINVGLYDYKTLSILEYFEIQTRSETAFIYLNPQTQKPIAVLKSEMDAKADYLSMNGYGEPITKRKIKVKECIKYITNGVEILKESRVPGGMIPIIPVYGERNFVDGVENCEGLYQLTKDSQRLIDMQMNYLADMVAMNPRPRPEFDPREIEGLEGWHDDAGENNLGYVLRNKVFYENGERVDFPAPTYTQPTQIPPAVAELLTLSANFIKENTNPGLTEDAFNTNASGEALKQIIKQIDVLSYVFIDNFAEAMRRDAEVAAAMNAELMDTTREVTVTSHDGSTVKERVNVFAFDAETGEPTLMNKVHGNKFIVTYDVGPSYQSKKESAVQSLRDLLANLPDGDPTKQVVMLALLSNIDGQGLDEVNKYARFSLLSQGLPGFEPNNDEEEQFVAMLQQQQQMAAMQPDPMQQLVEAETAKSAAAAQKDQAMTAKTLADTEQARAKTIEILAGIDQSERQQYLDAMALMQNLFQNMNQPSAT